MERGREVKTALAKIVVEEVASVISVSGSWERLPLGFMRLVITEGVGFLEAEGAKGWPFCRSA